MTKTLLSTLTLTTLLTACGQSPAEPFKIDTTDAEEAVFSDASDDELYTTLLVGTGSDLATAYIAALETDAMSLTGCTTATVLEDGVRYEGTGDPACSMSGTITVHGVSEAGWSLSLELPSTFAITFDDAEIEVDAGPGRTMVQALDGMLMQESDAAGWPIRTEANLTQVFNDEIEIHSGLIIERDPDDAMTMTHGPESEAYVKGVGWFNISGSTMQVEQADGSLATEGSFAFRGHETMVFDMSRDSDDCLPFTIDGEMDRICGY